MNHAKIYCYVSVAFLIEADEGETALIGTGWSFIFQAQRSYKVKNIYAPAYEHAFHHRQGGELNKVVSVSRPLTV